MRSLRCCQPTGAHLAFIIRLEKVLGVEFETSEIMVMNTLQNAESIARSKVST